MMLVSWLRSPWYLEVLWDLRGRYDHIPLLIDIQMNIFYTCIIICRESLGNKNCGQMRQICAKWKQNGIKFTIGCLYAPSPSIKFMILFCCSCWCLVDGVQLRWRSMLPLFISQSSSTRICWKLFRYRGPGPRYGCTCRHILSACL